ncbi:SPOR domain-containing protein [Marinobacter daepoensis]|uniref:SPOR domain-containing protein n=1 Tax=Marinobacter daepoensis TaxID=262077 RepID=UPI001C95057C|nr:SPOR domain-containing protein [Marinobacter daepoensis]
MDGLKQRIIGALVLVSLAVIFVPMIFDEPHSQRQSTPITIPEEPPFPEVDMPESRPPDPQDGGFAGTEAAGSPQDSESPGFRVIEDGDREAHPDETTPDTVSPEAPAPQVATEPPVQPDPAPVRQPEPVKEQPRSDSKPSEKAEFTGSLSGAWVVQLGSFGNQDNARRLRDKVLDMGYGAHLQQLERGDSSLTRVFSGPFVSKDDAQEAKTALDKAFGLNSLVTTGDK